MPVMYDHKGSYMDRMMKGVKMGVTRVADTVVRKYQGGAVRSKYTRKTSTYGEPSSPTTYGRGTE